MAVVAAGALLAGCAADPTPSARWAAAPPPPAASSSPAVPGVATTTPVDRRAEYGIPTFPPLPPAQRITLPAGDSVPYLHRIPTDQKVAFLTIDDGYLKTPEAPQVIAAAGIPVTLFLTTDAVKDDPDYFRPMLDAGAVIESHTVTHANLRGKSYAFQRREICDSSDKLGKWFKRRPTLFRPPFGNQDATTLKAAKDCGMTAAFMWTETVHKGKVRYQEGKTVKPGDIILMHFRKSFRADFVAALRAICRAGLTPALLQDYLPG